MVTGSGGLTWGWDLATLESLLKNMTFNVFAGRLLRNQPSRLEIFLTFYLFLHRDFREAYEETPATV